MNQFWAGIVGAMVGGALTLVGQWQLHRWQTSERRNRDLKRKSVLKQLLDKPGPTGWRKMKTLSGVIGADRDETARLLIGIDARASESGNDV